MTTKRICTVLGRILLSTAFMTLFLFSYSASEFDQMNHLMEQLGEILIVFLMLTLSFFATNEWMRIKNKIHKPFPYFLWITLIPMIISAILLLITVPSTKANLVDVFLDTLIPVGSVSLFLGVIHYIKYNINLKKESRTTINMDTLPMLKKVLLYAFGLSIIYSFIIFIPSYRHIPLANLNLIIDLISNFIIAVICWYLILSFHKYLEKKASFFTAFIITIIGIAIIMQFALIFKLITLGIFHGYLDAVLQRITFWNVILGNFNDTLYIIFCVLIYQFLYFNKTRVTEQKAFKAEIVKQTEKYENLRRQLSPHFLFNNINVLTALIEENPAKAVHFSESLGNIYRHFLRQEDEDVVSLQSALSFSKDYLELLKYRYENGFHYTLPKTVDSNYYIIPLALQQVIENTIKHNEVSKVKPLHITIATQDEYLIVQNTKQLKSITEDTKKTGIDNIKKRFAFLTEKEVIVEDTSNSFIIKLPILNMEDA